MGYIDMLIEKLKEACEPMVEKKIITLGDILDLLDRDDTKITLRKTEADGLKGSASSSLWATLEELPVDAISISMGTLEVWLASEEDGDGEA